MLSTRNHAPAPAEIVVSDEGTPVVRFRDQWVHEHTSGRSKGMIEHTVVQLHFADRETAIEWFQEAARKLIAE